MSDKSIIFKARVDSSELTKDIEAIKQKMRQLQAGPEAVKGFVSAKDRLSSLGADAGATPSDRSRAAQQEKEFQERAIRFAKEQTDIATRANKLYDQRHERIKQINADVAAGARKDKEAQEEILKLEKQKYAYVQAMISASANANRTMGSLPPPAVGGLPALSGGGGVGGPPAISGGGGSGGAGGGGGGRGALAFSAGMGVIFKGIQILSAINSNERAVNSAQGNANVGLIGEQTSNIFSGNNFENVMFRKQRGKALDSATREGGREEAIDWLKLGAGVATVIGGGLAFATGAAAAPFTGGLSLGASVAGAAALTAGTAMMMSPIQRSLLSGNKEDYAALTAQRQAGMYQENYQAELNKNTMYTQAVKTFGSQAPENVGFQRATGMSSDKFEEMMSVGDFTRSQLLGAGNGILSAGGSSRAAQNLAPFASGMSRNFGITNASSVLGTLSGSIGDDSKSQNAFIKIMSEATRLGFDSTEFAAENRKFIDVASKLAVGAGARDEDAAARIAKELSSGVISKTSMGIEAAASSEQKINQVSSQSSGAGAAVEWAAMKTNNALKGASNKVLAAYTDSTKDEILSLPSDDIGLLSLAKETGSSVEEVRGALVSAKGEKVDATGQISQEINKNKELIRKNFGGNVSKAMQDSGFRAGLGGAKGAIHTYLPKMTAMEEESYITKQLGGLTGAPETYGPPAPTRKEGKSDVEERSRAAGDAAAAKLISTATEEIVKDFGDGSKALKDYTEELVKAMQAVQRANHGGTTTERDAANKNLHNVNNGGAGTSIAERFMLGTLFGSPSAK